MFNRSLRPKWNAKKPVIDKDRKIAYLLWCSRFVIIRLFFAPLEYFFYKLFIKDQIKLPSSPVIILGHHRSGTTFLQGLLIANPEYKSVRLFDTLFPDIMILGNKTLRPVLNFLLKIFNIEMELHKKRMHMDFPGEEDVALLSLLNPLAYNWGHIYPDNIDEIARTSIVDLTPNSPNFKSWKEDYLMFLKKFLFLYPEKCLVLKSPPSVARPHLMQEIFPRAKYIFLMRDPYTLYPSMINFWKISNKFTFQEVKDENIDQLIFGQSNILLENYIHLKNCIPPENLIEIRHSDLQTDPLRVLEAIHAKLELGDFKKALPHYEQYIALDKGVGIRKKTGEFSALPENRKKVEYHWGKLIEYYNSIGPM
ncbi:MAG: sulfotransferase [Bacteriovorax sp.]|jgi:hypothetical protein